MRFINPDADRNWLNFGAGATDDAPATPPEPPPQLFGYGTGSFEATPTGTYHWNGPQYDTANVSDEQSQQHDTANVSSDGGTFQWAGSLEMPQTGTYWQEPTFANDTDGDFPPDIQEAPPPPDEPFTASFFAA